MTIKVNMSTEIKIEHSFLDENNVLCKQRFIKPFPSLENLPVSKDFKEFEKKLVEGQIKLHSLNKPASIFYLGNNKIYEAYWENGLKHRLDGPSVIELFGKETKSLYYINNNLLSRNQFAQQTGHIICKLCYDFCNQKCFF